MAKNILFVCDASGPGLGGVPIFNQRLVTGLAGSTAYKPLLLTVRPKGKTDDQLREDHPGVEVSIIPNPRDLDEPDSLRLLLEDAVRSTQDPTKFGLPEAHRLTSAYVVVGHSRFSGPAAVQIVQKWYEDARYAHILHTSPLRLGQIQGKALAKAMRNASIELDCLSKADLGSGVGPLLTDTLRELRTDGQTPRIHELVPGSDPSAGPVPLREDKTDEDTLNLLLLGRADDMTKGLPDAISAVRKLNEGFTHNSVTYRPSRARLTVIGVPPERTPDPGIPTLLEVTQRWANEMCGQDAQEPPETRRVTVLHTTNDREFLIREIRGCDAMIAPSHTEGFGLVSLEALEQGVPVLASEESGFARFVLDPSRVPADVGQACVVQDSGFAAYRPFLWARALHTLKRNLHQGYLHARTLHTLLGHFTWTHSASSLVEAAQNLQDFDTRQGRDGTVEKDPNA
ncbi:glycosyltransferase family 4 protein [Streptomyces sp. RPA4-5]|uniref:glycosyltransferase family 4 protein n=1 Tax=Streptomyces TaxID=1883 RepID=UPI00143ED6D0|nr:MULTISPECIES: glycosyltransferase family 4 protein [Streptomyces]MCX4637149.1 glycosyltransferase family 4 protein [Streptomyces platensis]QIY54099.1 glycosyltransferase family 4 protein [Streptomyces sp. RPA4-5]WJY36676.1 glycosyltransferase family 4 protein [Streptomyces sp. P9-2B-2]